MHRLLQPCRPVVRSVQPGVDQVRQNTEAIEVEPGTLGGGARAEYRPARLRPLAEVSAAVEAKLRAEQNATLLAKKGEATLQALAKG